MKTRAKTLTLAAGAALLAAALGAGCHRGGDHHRDPAKIAAFVTDRVDDLLDDVDATAEQRQRIHATKDRLLAEGARARGDRDALRAELLAAWRSETVDRARLHARVDERIEALRAFAHAAADGAAEVHDVLTPAQREKLAAKAERRMRR